MRSNLWVGFLMVVVSIGLLASPIILRLREDRDRQVQRETQVQKFLDMLARIRSLLAVWHTRA